VPERSARSTACRLSAGALACCLILAGCNSAKEIVDDAKAAGRTVAEFPETSSRLFKDMDGGIDLTEAQIKGRNSWILWTAGNQVFWDLMANRLCGVVDLIKTLDSRKRPQRFAEMGLMNEPGFRQASGPDWFGLWVDQPIGTAPADIDEEIYGRSSGVIGFRIYPNPDFDAAAKARWNPERFYSDPTYCDANLVRPYRIGVTCGVCHVAPNPLKPPADPENPEWENLSSAVGNQYNAAHRAA
jgi:predicted small secreted protein